MRKLHGSVRPVSGLPDCALCVHGTYGFALRRLTAGKSEVADISGRAAVHRSFREGIHQWPKQPLRNPDPHAVAGFRQLRAQRIDAAPFRFRRPPQSVNGQIVGAELHLPWSAWSAKWQIPSLPEMRVNGFFCMSSAVKAQIFRKAVRTASAVPHWPSVPAGQRRRQTFPKAPEQAALSVASFSGRIEAYTSWFFAIHSCRESCRP